jgi:hypothetical protein
LCVQFVSSFHFLIAEQTQRTLVNPARVRADVETKAIRRKEEGGIACGIISAARYDDNRLGLLGRATSIS